MPLIQYPPTSHLSAAIVEDRCLCLFPPCPAACHLQSLSPITSALPLSIPGLWRPASLRASGSCPPVMTAWRWRSVCGARARQFQPVDSTVESLARANELNKQYHRASIRVKRHILRQIQIFTQKMAKALLIPARQAEVQPPPALPDEWSCEYSIRKSRPLVYRWKKTAEWMVSDRKCLMLGVSKELLLRLVLAD